MSYQSLLVLLDREKACTARSILAMHLAQAFGAHVSGFAPAGLVDLPATTVDVLAATSYTDEALDVF